MQSDTVNGYYNDGTLSLNGSDFLAGGPDLRPNALIPFAAPTSSAFTASTEAVPFFSKAAVGFTTSGTLNKNFETNGQAWLEVNTMANFPAGGGTFVDTWTFHTGGSSGPTFSGVFDGDPYSYNRLAVSYDPVNHIATASVNDVVVASTPFSAQTIKYVGVEGSWYATFDNFTVKAGAIAVPPPATAAISSTSTTTTSSSVSSSVLGTDQQTPLI